MKYLITMLAVLTLAGSAALAGCGKKVASIGKLEKVDAATKTITVAVMESSNAAELKSKKATLTLSPETKIIIGDKVDGKIDDLVGKQISVVSEHGKVEFVIALAAKS